MLSIKAKIVIAYTVVFGLLLTAFALLTYKSAYDSEVAKLDARMESHADKIATEMEEDYRERDFPSRAIFDSIQTGGLQGVKVRVLDLQKHIVYADSGFLLDVNMGRSLADVSTVQKSFIELSSKNYRIMQWPVEIENRIQYVVQIAATLDEIEGNLDHLRFLFVVLMPVGLFLSGGAAYFISTLAFRPMMNMVQKAGTISATTLDARLDLPAVKDEVHLLGHALNAMIDRIDGAMRSQKQFIADASHELRTPLTIMRSELEYAHRTARTLGVKKNIAASLGELDHFSGMVNDLLTLARLDGPQARLDLSPIRLDELIIECFQAVRGRAKKKQVRLRLFIEDAMEIEGDHKKLLSVFLNILENAVKYSPGNKVVSATLTATTEAPRMARIAIKDNGPGIPSGELERVFTRFYRGVNSRSKNDGSGLGLAIAQRFVELHRGRIVLQSIEGKGSTFTVELPMREP